MVDLATLSHPFGTYCAEISNPGVETPGYCRLSLRDRKSHLPQVALAINAKAQR